MSSRPAQFIWELSLGIYLIVKGFKPSPILTGTGTDPVGALDRLGLHLDRAARALLHAQAAALAVVEVERVGVGPAPSSLITALSGQTP